MMIEKCVPVYLSFYAIRKWSPCDMTPELAARQLYPVSLGDITPVSVSCQSRAARQLYPVRNQNAKRHTQNETIYLKYFHKSQQSIFCKDCTSISYYSIVIKCCSQYKGKPMQHKCQAADSYHNVPMVLFFFFNFPIQTTSYISLYDFQKPSKAYIDIYFQLHNIIM